MKKKTAITLASLALLAGGVTFGGIKIKEKKEKDKIEKELKEILIPGAEAELERWEEEESRLSDSVAYYANQLETLGQDTVVSKSDIKNMIKLLSSAKQDWEQAFGKWWNKNFETAYEGDGYFNEELLPAKAREEMRYLIGGMLKDMDKDKDWYIPGTVEDWVYPTDSKGRITGYARLKEVAIGRPVYFEDITLADEELQYVDEVIYGLKTSLSQWEELDAKQKRDLLKAIKSFVDNIDNSRGIINKKTLQELSNIVGKAFPKQDLKFKVTKFRSAKESAKRMVNDAEKKLQELQRPDIVNKLYKEMTEQVKKLKEKGVSDEELWMHAENIRFYSFRALSKKDRDYIESHPVEYNMAIGVLNELIQPNLSKKERGKTGHMITAFMFKNNNQKA